MASATLSPNSNVALRVLTLRFCRHPEKNPYEWNPDEGINHSADAIVATQYIAQFLVNEARKSPHSFPSNATLANYTIFQYSSVYTWPIVNDYEECYFFD